MLYCDVHSIRGDKNVCIFLRIYERVQIYMNEQLFDTDMMYKSKMWKAHRQEYILWCKKLKVFNDYDNIEEEVTSYEERLMRIKYKIDIT